MDDFSFADHMANSNGRETGCTESLFRGDFSQFAQSMAHSAEEFARQLWVRGWLVVNFGRLPTWLKDNNYLVRGHRPALHSFRGCFKSVFRIHTETGNIWTHLLGCVLFCAISIYFIANSPPSLRWQDKIVFSSFFLSAITCLGFSCVFHTLSCHSPEVARFANKLDYTGIAILTVGSFVPFLYYTFYCGSWEIIVYMILISILGGAAICISMIDKFSNSRYRALRAIVFISLGLFGIFPTMHYTILAGWESAIRDVSLGWLILMAFFYISGAILYALRIPERIFPGLFDLWFQSHQIFHIFVVVGALIHYYSITRVCDFRLTRGDCRPTLPIAFHHKNQW